MSALVNAVFVPPSVEIGAPLTQFRDQLDRRTVAGIGTRLESEALHGRAGLFLPVDATAIITVATTGTAPLHQLLGSDSLGLAEGRIAALTADVAASRELGVATDIGA